MLSFLVMCIVSLLLAFLFGWREVGFVQAAKHWKGVLLSSVVIQGAWSLGYLVTEWLK